MHFVCLFCVVFFSKGSRKWLPPFPKKLTEDSVARWVAVGEIVLTLLFILPYLGKVLATNIY